MDRICTNCKKKLVSRFQKKFCSNKCQIDFQYLSYIENWRLGENNGNRGINTKNISSHLRRYLIEKYKEKCSLCGWSKINIITGRVPLEIDHIDGNYENNEEGNIRLICPNCHSLTGNFKNSNNGKGREWRRNKYLKNIK